MNYTKIIVINTLPLDNRRKQLFCLDKIIESGREVDFLNISKISTKEEGEELQLEGVLHFDINSKKEFENYVKKQSNKNCLYMICANLSSYTYACYKILSTYDCNMLYCDYGNIPTISLTNRLYKILNIKNSSELIKRQLYKLLIKYGNQIKPLKYLLVTGKISGTLSIIDSNTQIVPYNTLDYEAYKNDVGVIDLPYKKIIVFIDQYLPYHNNYLLEGCQLIDAKTYYDRLNKCFSDIERKYNCNVVIAAHPVAESYKQCNPFDNRKIYFNSCVRLVKNSEGVITHCSTAIAHCVLAQKSLILLTSDEIEKKYINTFKEVVLYSQVLGSQLYNIDRNNDYVFPTVDQAKYATYKYNYLTNKNSENLSNTEILNKLL